MDCRSMADSNVYRRPPQSRTSGVTRRPRLRLPLLGTKRTFKVLRRRSDVEGRADMARTLPEGDPRYATDFLPRNGWCRLPTRGRGRLRFIVALAAPLPATRYAGTRCITLAYEEKVQPKFLSLGRDR